MKHSITAPSFTKLERNHLKLELKKKRLKEKQMFQFNIFKTFIFKN